MSKKVMVGMAFIMSVLTLAVLTFFGGTESKAQTVKDTDSFEYKTVSEGENTCRISEIRIKKDKGISELKIPGTIDGMTVVSIGEERKKNKWSEEVDWNAFLMYEDPETGWTCESNLKAQKRRAKKVKKIILPDTIQEIRDYAFAGLSGLKSIELSKSLTTIGRCAFGETSIQKMHLPPNLTSIGINLFFKSPIKDINIPAKLKDGVLEIARTTVSWKRFSVSKKNPYYKTKKNFLFSKDGKTIYALIKSKKNIRIPDKVETIAEWAFYETSLQSVYLGAGVNEIKGGALTTKTRCKITISPKNPYLARSGMCIYHKQKRNLLVGIPKKSNERVTAQLKKIYVLKISSKVKKLDVNFSIVGIGKKYKVRKVYIPKSVEMMPRDWSLGFWAHKHCTYVTERNYS